MALAGKLVRGMSSGELIGWASTAGALVTFGACAISFPDYPEGAGGAGSAGSGGLGGSVSSVSSGGTGGSVVGCMPPCIGATTCCDGKCVDTATDPANCDRCGMTCDMAAGKGCCGGACVNTATDPANCDECGMTCDMVASEICARGERGPACANIHWARWPMPNGDVDVNGGAPNLAAHTNNGDGTVTDNVTGLMWQLAVENTQYTQEGAKDYCAITLSDQGLGGHHDWRLPSRVELVSLVDYGKISLTIDDVFAADTPPGNFWSATPYASVPSYAWYVYFVDGSVDVLDEVGLLWVRCVR